MATQKKRKAVLVLPDVGIKESHLEGLKADFHNHLVGSLHRAGGRLSDDVVVVVVVVIVEDA